MNSIFPGTRIRAVFGSGTPKLVVNVKDEEGRSNYWPYIPIVSEIPQINWKLKGDVHSSATMLHELGHALGLGDAYIEGVWSCKEGQPYISVMCNDSQITADDIRGIQWLLCRHTGRCNEHNYLDMYGGDGGAFKISECMELGTDGIFHQGLVQSVSVKWGGYVDSIGITCRDTFTGELYSLTRMGGAGGVYSRTFSCQGSAYLTGAKLRTGSLVDSIELLCSDGTTSGRMGGNGGTLWEYRCPAEYPYLKGIRTRSGNYVDKIGLTCANRLGYYSEPEFLEDTPPEPPQLPADPKKPIPEFPIPAPPQPENPLPAPIEPKVPYYTVVNKRNLAMLGGPGGNSAKIECKPTREGPAIRSIYVRWGTLIDFIKITCADGSTKSFGGPGGSFQKTVALENKMGSLKSLGILHKSGQFFLGPSYSALAELKVGSYSDTVAFTGRGISATQQCSASEHLIGFNVRSGGYIDAIGGICATVR